MKSASSLRLSYENVKFLIRLRLQLLLQMMIYFYEIELSDCETKSLYEPKRTALVSYRNYIVIRP